MEHKKDIGKAIRDKLDALDKSPGDQLWSAIEADLPKKKKRRILPFWFFLITGMVVGIWIWSGRDADGAGVKPQDDGTSTNTGKGSRPGSDSNDKSSAGAQTPAADPATETASPSHENAIGGNASASSTNVSDASGQSANKTAVAERKNKHAALKKRSAVAYRKKHEAQGQQWDFNNQTKQGNPKNDKGISASAENGDDASQSRSGNDHTVAAVSGATDGKIGNETQQDSLKTAIAKTEDKKPEEKPKDSLKTDEFTDGGKTFRIFLYAAPTYYNTFSKISSIDKRLDTLSRKAEITYNYGGYLCFDYDDKWSFRFGAAKTTLRHRTQNIAVSSLGEVNYYNVDYGNASNADLQPRFANSEYFDLIQEISYLEFPMELKYKLRDDKIGIEAIGGISSSFLKANTITAESQNDGSVILGSTKDQYKWYLSANAGVGFYWQFAENFRLNVEPIFKYHFRTASTALQPYSVVVLGGIEYTFHWKSKNKKK
ncbi:hypothetical protein FLLO111716_11615 [Flavobacterium longum]|uniref:hypothetical protein n=1 Tax=Flavobacterium longum TaxID=1299340 RepID=UPI0039E78A94